MADAADRSGKRVLAGLAALLVAGIAFVAWLALRPDTPDAPPPAPPPTTAPKHEPAPVPVPRKPRPHAEDAIRVAPAVPSRGPKPGEVPDPEEEPIEIDVHGPRRDGTDAAGAAVVLLDPFAQHVQPRRAPVLERKRADDHGRVVFSTVNRMLRVHAWLGVEAASSERFEAQEQKGTLTLHLAEAFAVRGRVVQAGGGPIAKATVRFELPALGEDPFGFLVDGTTDVDGRFELPSIPLSAMEDR